MKKLLLGMYLIAQMAQGGIRDDGWRYVVPPSACVAVADGKVPAGGPLVVRRDNTGSSVILMRYDLADLPVKTSLYSEIWFKGTASGAGTNPSFAVYGVENDWDATKVSMDTLPRKVARITEMTARPNLAGSIPLVLSRYLQEHIKDGRISLLLEMRSAPGFSREVTFSGTPMLGIAKAQTPAYRLADLLKPVWKGDRMTAETVAPISYDGKAAEGNLAFQPSKILGVQDYAFGRTYTEGKDYTVDGRTIRLLPGSAIPFFNDGDLYHNNPDAKPKVMKTPEGYLTTGDPAFFNDKQLVVTYEHKADPWTGPVPVSAEQNLPATFSRLKAGKPLKLLVFGDSISVGASASGKSSMPPFLPRWSDLVADELHRVYGSPVDVVNASLGGMTSDWGRKTVEGLASFEKPDLVILGFGMNDAENNRCTTEQFVANTQAIMASIRKQNPAVEFLLLMSWQPNPKWRSPDPMPAYLEALKKMEGPGVAVADVWSLHGYLLKHKTYCDMTANLANHPNDFMVRMYAQVLLARLGVQ